jgi:hypothetical protein
MKPNQRTSGRPQGKSGADHDDRGAMPHDANVPARKPSGIQTNVQYSPSGDPDHRRDDDIAPSPEGPATGRRGDADVEGVHDRRHSNVERE